jgi:hypothetical protein
LVGLGWWCWIIPLKGGDVSVGLVYDSRLFQPPQTGTIGERLKAHFDSHPVGREILGNAEPVAGDQKAYSSLPYYSDQIAGDGWVIAGDAAGFIDPLYSPGLDFCSFTSHGAASLVGRALEGENVGEQIASWNERFAFCFRAWFESIYQDKYYYLGDAELMAAAFLHDIASYHLGPVRQVYSDPSRQFDAFPFDGIPGRIVHRVMRFFNRRLTAVAKRKLAAGTYGDRNADWRFLVPGFLPDASAGKMLTKGVVRLIIAEIRSLLASVRPKPVAVSPSVVAEAQG